MEVYRYGELKGSLGDNVIINDGSSGRPNNPPAVHYDASTASHQNKHDDIMTS